MKLIFVYNADSGALNALIHAIHKAVRPSTYDCQLCAITYDTVSENNAWRDFRKNSKHDMVFLHRDEFERDYSSQLASQSSLSGLEYPVVIAGSLSGEVSESSDALNVVIHASEMSQIPSTSALISRISAL